MPSSGYGIEDIIRNGENIDPAEFRKRVEFLLDCKERAEKYHMFVEWLMSFVAAWNKTHDVYIAASAGLDEWDL